MFIFSFQISEKNKIFIHVMCIHNLILVLLAMNRSSGKGNKVQKVQNISSPCTPALYRCND